MGGLLIRLEMPSTLSRLKTPKSIPLNVDRQYPGQGVTEQDTELSKHQATSLSSAIQCGDMRSLTSEHSHVIYKGYTSPEILALHQICAVKLT